MNTLKLFSIALMAVCSLTLSACSGEGTGTKDASSSIERVLSSRQIRAGFINYPPSMMIEPNTEKKSGIMVDVIEAAAKAMDVKVEYVEETTFASMVDALDSGRVDIVVSGIWPSSARALKADFSRAVYYSPVLAYVKMGDARFAGDLSSANSGSVKVATIDGELSSIIAQSDYPNAAVVSLPQQADVSQLLLQLQTNKADITFVEPAIAEEFLAKNPDSIQPVSGSTPVRVFANSFLFRKGDTEFREAINIAIIELINSGSVGRIIDGYDPSGQLFVRAEAPVSP